MLIINADDLGRNSLTTDRILACYGRGRITSTSAMVFMEDSERAAKLSRAAGLDTGLHLNFTEEFTGKGCNDLLLDYHRSLVRCLTRSRFASLFYHPMLRNKFHYVFQAQITEFVRLYNAPPSHFDGHHHMHLCANMLFGAFIPKGQKVRRNPSFRAGEKSAANRLYRALVDWWLLRKYRSTESLFSLPSCRRSGNLGAAIERSRSAHVELETHPEMDEDFHYLMSDEFLEAISKVERGTYSLL